MLCEAEMTIKRTELDGLADYRRDVLRHPDALGLFEMWDALRGDRAAPFRAELDATKIGARAPFLAIFEQVDTSVFRTRIAGDRLNRWFGLELRGMSALSLAVPACRNHLQAALNRVTGEPAAAVLHGAAIAEDGRAHGFELALLPMRSDFGPVDRVLLGMWLDPAADTPLRPVRLRIDEITTSTLAASHGEMTLAEPPSQESPHPRGADAPHGDLDASASGEAPARPIRRGHLRLVVSNPAPDQRRK
jgi:hypothetical protein